MLDLFYEKRWGLDTSLLPPLRFLIQTHAFYGTDADIVIQTAIQMHAFYGTDVQTSVVLETSKSRTMLGKVIRLYVS